MKRIVYQEGPQTRKEGQPLHFFHAADLHLGLGWNGSGASLKEERRRAGFESFQKLLKYVSESRAQLLLLAGDLLELSSLSTSEVNLLVESLRCCPCPIVLTPGNHDPFRATCSYARIAEISTVCVLEDEWTVVEFPQLKTLVWGAGFAHSVQRESLLPEGSVETWCQELGYQSEEWLHIGVLHGQVGVQESRYNPLPFERLASSHMDYWALGHVHKSEGPAWIQDSSTQVGSWWNYSGCLQGNGFDEQGAHGCYELKLFPEERRTCGKALKLESIFHPLAEREFRILSLSLPYSAEVGTLVETILQELEKLGEEPKQHYYRIHICGRWPAQFDWRLDQLESALKPHFHYLQLRLQTAVQWDVEALSQEYSLRGHSLKKALQARERASEQEQENLDLALRLLLQAFEEDVCYKEVP